MRIPFIAKVSDREELGVEADRFRFIADTKGGSAFLFAGAMFWLTGSAVSLIWPAAEVEWVLYGGLTVPLIGLAIGHLQGAILSSNPIYASLAGLAAITELAAIPTMFFLRNSHPEALPGILLIADGAHLLILMWLHLDYTYFLAANIKIVLGGLFLYGALWSGSYPAQLAAAGVVSLVAGALVWRDSSRTLELYLKPGPS
jgi:hypothetical protein